jgi:hypothetical protein
MGAVKSSVFHVIPQTQGLALHFGEVTGALLSGHGSGDFLEMAEHLCLTFGAEGGDFGQLLFYSRADVGGSVQQ